MWLYILENIIIVSFFVVILKKSETEYKLCFVIGLITIDIVVVIISLIIKPQIELNRNNIDVISSDLIQGENTENVENNGENEQNQDNTSNENDEKIVVYKDPEEEKKATGVIYLTFDDGPSTSSTPVILDILKEKDVKATFFILNFNEEGEELLKRELAEGHTIGIHGYSHDYKKIYKSVDIYMENVIKLQEKIKQVTGYEAKNTRFPGGSSNTVSRYNPGIMTELTQVVVERGFKYFDWNVSSEDAGSAKNSDDVYYNVVNYLEPGRDNVVLMHDFANNHKTMDSLAAIIDFGKENGYIFKAIDDNTPMVTHHVNN